VSENLREGDFLTHTVDLVDGWCFEDMAFACSPRDLLMPAIDLTGEA